MSSRAQTSHNDDCSHLWSEVTLSELANVPGVEIPFCNGGGFGVGVASLDFYGCAPSLEVWRSALEVASRQSRDDVSLSDKAGKDCDDEAAGTHFGWCAEGLV